MIAASLLAIAIFTVAPHHAGPHERAPHAKIVAQAPTPTPSAIATPAPSIPPGPTVAPTGAPSSGGPSAAATPVAPVATSTATLVPLPSATPSLAPTPSPYAYRFVPRQPNHLDPGQPQIFAVYINQKKLRSHGPIRIKVETSANVVKVVSRSNGREGIVPLVSAGDFEATSVLPTIPFIAAGMTVDLEFIATGPDGRKATVRVPVLLD